MFAFEYPIRPFTFGPRSPPFFAMPYLAVGGVGPWAWVGVAGRWARRTLPPPSSAVSFFFATWPFLAIRKTRVLPDTDGRTDGRRRRNRAPPRPPFQEQKIAKILSPFFFGDFKKGKGIFVNFSRNYISMQRGKWEIRKVSWNSISGFTSITLQIRGGFGPSPHVLMLPFVRTQGYTIVQCQRFRPVGRNAGPKAQTEL